MSGAGSASYKSCETEGPESNPLTSKISFQRWISCLPRWIFEDPHKACLVSLPFLCDSAPIFRDGYRTFSTTSFLCGLFP